MIRLAFSSFNAHYELFCDFFLMATLSIIYLALNSDDFPWIILADQTASE